MVPIKGYMSSKAVFYKYFLHYIGRIFLRNKVMDPETGIDVVSMGLIKELELTDSNKVNLIFSPSVPTCLLGFKLAFDIRNAIDEIK